jgi:ATP adenylyltransferase
MNRRFEPGRLWQAVLDRSASAREHGALHSIETDHQRLEQDGIPFVVRVATNLKRKAEDKRRRREEERDSGREFNPFLPPEPELTVTDVTDTHLAVLNKFNVVEHHLLIVTRHFEAQETLLNLADFEALWLCLREYDSLGFYNGGTEAGASQKHKHLQLVPLPLYAGEEDAYPMAPVFEAAAAGTGVRRLPGLPFVHEWRRLPENLADDPLEAARLSLDLYREMLHRCGVDSIDGPGGPRQSHPYNLLLTRRWMLLVPRSQEFCAGISVNSLGYVGSLFVKDGQDLQRLRETGPLSLLRAVSMESP